MIKGKNKDLIREIMTILKNNHSILIEVKEMINLLLEAEKRKREEDILQFKNANEYEKLLLNNLTSRISILEEEQENYERKRN